VASAISRRCDGGNAARNQQRNCKSDKCLGESNDRRSEAGWEEVYVHRHPSIYSSVGVIAFGLARSGSDFLSVGIWQCCLVRRAIAGEVASRREGEQGSASHPTPHIGARLQPRSGSGLDTFDRVNLADEPTVARYRQ
jgi:hypothetical protein